MSCEYADKGCNKADDCQKTRGNCAMAKYFDFIVMNSCDCKNSIIDRKCYVDMWANRKTIDVKCEGCSRVDGKYCSAYMNPSDKWPKGAVSYANRCPASTHIEPEKKTCRKTNALKASKRLGGRR